MISIGVDPHKRTYVAAAVDALGRPLGTLSVAATAQGQQALLDWAATHGAGAADRRWGVEGAGGYGWPLAQALVAAGGRVHGVPASATARERRAAVGRAREKTDTTDALAVARVAARESAALPAVRGDGIPQQLKVLTEHRDNLLLQRTRVLNQLHAHLAALRTVHAPSVGPLKKTGALTYWAQLELPGADALTRSRLLIVRQLAALALTFEPLVEALVEALDAELARLTAEAATPLVGPCGASHLTAAKILGEVGDVARFATPAKFAAYCGVAPLAASSGPTVRHRLSRRGNRQLNRALHTVAPVQRRWEPRARAYFARKLAEGKTRREAMRSLKRALANVIYRLLAPDRRVTPPGRLTAAALT